MKEATMDPAPNEWRSSVEHKMASLFRRQDESESRLDALEAAFQTPGFIVKYVPMQREEASL